MLFYSLALNYNSTWKSENAGLHRVRFLVITPDRNTSDLLFRVIQDNPRGLTERVSYDEIRRLSPQMWSWSATGHDDHTGIQQTIVDINRGMARPKDNRSKEHLEKLRGKVTFQYVGDWTENFFIIPHLDMPDHISGHHFCIRSKRVPSQFWHYPHANAHQTKNVTLSTTERAIFKISAEGARDKETLIVDTDKVQLDLVVVENGSTQYVPVGVDPNGLLIAPPRGEVKRSFTLGTLFRGAFVVGFFESDRSKLFPRMVNNNDVFEGGERWELC